MSDADGRDPSPVKVDVQVLGPIPEGSLLVLPGFEANWVVDQIRESLRQLAGHDKFMLLLTPGAGHVTLLDMRADADEVVRRLSLITTEYPPRLSASARLSVGPTGVTSDEEGIHATGGICAPVSAGYEPPTAPR